MEKKSAVSIFNTNLFNWFLFFAVPVATMFKFHVMFICGDEIAILGRKYGLPATWNKSTIRKVWYKTSLLETMERQIYEDTRA